MYATAAGRRRVPSADLEEARPLTGLEHCPDIVVVARPDGDEALDHCQVEELAEALPAMQIQQHCAHLFPKLLVMALRDSHGLDRGGSQ